MMHDNQKDYSSRQNSFSRRVDGAFSRFLFPLALASNLFLIIPRTLQGDSYAPFIGFGGSFPQKINSPAESLLIVGPTCVRSVGRTWVHFSSDGLGCDFSRISKTLPNSTRTSTASMLTLCSCTRVVR